MVICDDVWLEFIRTVGPLLRAGIMIGLSERNVKKNKLYF